MGTKIDHTITDNFGINHTLFNTFYNIENIISDLTNLKYFEMSNEIKDQRTHDDPNKSSLQSNSKHTTTDQEGDLHLKILQKYKLFQQETGITNDELFDLVTDIETADYPDEAGDIEDFTEESNFGSHEFWENRYINQTQPFEWYFDWKYAEPEVSQFVKNKDLALIIGCGNSEMSSELQQKDVKMIVSIDVSKTVISQMAEKYKENKNLLWYEMDCTDMSFKDELFDVVLDKGTFDAIFCGDNRISNILSSLSEIWRVLKNNGFFIEISFGRPKDRLNCFKKSDESWKFFDPIVVMNNAYIYVLQKIDNEEIK